MDNSKELKKLLIKTKKKVQNQRDFVEEIKGRSGEFGKGFAEICETLDFLTVEFENLLEEVHEQAAAREALPDMTGLDFMGRISTLPMIDTNKGLENSGSKELYEKVVGEFYDTGESRAETILMYHETGDVRNYTIQVHALKSAARIIGAMSLSHLAATLEEAGNAENKVRMDNGTPKLIEMYRELIGCLEVVVDSKSDKAEIDSDSIKDALMSVKENAEVFDFDAIDATMEELKKYSIPDEYKECYKKLKTLVAEVARDDIISLLEDTLNA